jgi:hypothetical protein
MRSRCARIFSWSAAAAFVLGLCTVRSFAGPPYLSDDPEPTDYQHYEIYAFTNGIKTRMAPAAPPALISTTAARQIFNSLRRFPWGIHFPAAALSWAG